MPASELTSLDLSRRFCGKRHPSIRLFFRETAALGHAFAVLAVAAWPTLASADHFGTLFPAGEDVCYARDYNDAHLKQHSNQTVTSMRVVRRNDPGLAKSEEEEVALSTDLSGVAFAEIAVTMRKTKSRLWSGSFDCRAYKEGYIRCESGECDGGGLRIKPASGGAALVYFDLESSDNNWFVVVGCDSAPDGGSISFSPRTDDTSFLLSRVPFAQCEGIRGRWE